MNTKKKIIITITILVALSSCLGLYRWYSTKQKPNINQNSSTVKNTIKTDDPLYPLIGIYKGTSYLIRETIVFPSSSLILQQNGDFEIMAMGYSLALLNDPDLQFDGVYPSLNITLKGATESQSKGLTKLIVTDVNANLTYLVGGIESPLDTDPTKKILSTLGNLGINIPQPSNSVPIIISSTIIPTTNGITLQPLKDQLIYTNFNGIK